METDLDVDQFLNTIYRYIQIGVHIRAYYSKKYNNFHREVDEVTEFYVDDDNKPVSRTIYRKNNEIDGVMIKPSEHLIEYLDNQNIDVHSIVDGLEDEFDIHSNETGDLIEKNVSDNKSDDIQRKEVVTSELPEMTTEEPLISTPVEEPLIQSASPEVPQPSTETKQPVLAKLDE
jgi:hypothetical protein